MNSLSMKLAILLAVNGLALQAGDYSWGIQVGALASQGDMKSHAFLGTQKSLGGSVLNLNFEWEVGQRNAVRLRFSGMGTGTGRENLLEQDPVLGRVTISTEWTSNEVGLDWRRQWTPGPNGWYSTLGLGLASPKMMFTIRAPLYPGGPTGGSTREVRQHSKLSMRLGLGYQINRHYNTELSYHQVNVDKSGADGLGIGAMKWLSLGLGLNFGRQR